MVGGETASCLLRSGSTAGRWGLRQGNGKAGKLLCKHVGALWDKGSTAMVQKPLSSVRTAGTALNPTNSTQSNTAHRSHLCMCRLAAG